MDKVSDTPRTDALADKFRKRWNQFAYRSDEDFAKQCRNTDEAVLLALNLERELGAQKKPCTDAKEQGHGCLRAVKAENELAAQKEQFRVLQDEMLVMMDERNAAVAALHVNAGENSRPQD